jgi:hypothetical protein
LCGGLLRELDADRLWADEPSARVRTWTKALTVTTVYVLRLLRTATLRLHRAILPFVYDDTTSRSSSHLIPADGCCCKKLPVEAVDTVAYDQQMATKYATNVARPRRKSFGPLRVFALHRAQKARILDAAWPARHRFGSVCSNPGHPCMGTRTTHPLVPLPIPLSTEFRAASRNDFPCLLRVLFVPPMLSLVSSRPLVSPLERHSIATGHSTAQTPSIHARAMQPSPTPAKLLSCRVDVRDGSSLDRSLSCPPTVHLSAISSFVLRAYCMHDALVSYSTYNYWRVVTVLVPIWCLSIPVVNTMSSSCQCSPSMVHSLQSPEES